MTEELLDRVFADVPPDVRVLAHQLARPSARIVPVELASTGPVVQLGGLPALPAGVQWPRWDGMPLDFLAGIDCAAVHSVLPDAPFPMSGRLLVFVESFLTGPGNELLGAMDPGSRDGWRLLLVPDGVTATEVSPPAVEGDAWEAALHSEANEPFERVERGLVAELTLPDPWDDPVPEAWSDGDDVYEALEQLDVAGVRGPFHRIGGWPQPTQSLPAGPVAPALGAERSTPIDHADLSLVLQLDTDDGDGGPGWMWGDAGVLFFYGLAEEVRRGDVDGVWLNWDCH